MNNADNSDKIAEALGKIAEKESEDMAQGMAKLAENLFEKGMRPQDAFGIKDSNANKLYGQAYQLFNTGKYIEASRLFRTLILMDASNPKYAFGLASCFHMLKEYENATKAYMNCSIIDPRNPIPFFHASDCYLKMNDKFSAITVLQMAIKRAGDKPEYAILKDRASMTIESINNDLTK